MIAAWMLYATLIAALCTATAHAVEAALRLGRRPGRVPWAAAVLGAVALPAAAYWVARIAPASDA